MDKYMQEALRLAKKASDKGEIPVGAVIVKNGKIIARAYNKRERRRLATAHAEILAIEIASKKLKSWRLDDCEIFVTLEPCLMCLGAILNARIKKLYYGCADDKRDKLTEKLKFSKANGLNHNLITQGEVCEKECRTLLKNFFELKRQRESARLD